MRYGDKPTVLTVSLEVAPAALPQVVFSEEALAWRVQNLTLPEPTREDLRKVWQAERERLLRQGGEGLVREEATFRLWGWAEEEQARESCLDRVPVPGAWGGETIRQLNAARWRALRLRRLLQSWTIEGVNPEGQVVPLTLEPVPDQPGITQLAGPYYALVTSMPELGSLIDGFLQEFDRALEGRADPLGR